MSISRKTNKLAVTFSYNGMVFNNKKEQNTNTHNCME